MDSTSVTLRRDRRSDDRRERAISLRWPERRRGFDRRKTSALLARCCSDPAIVLGLLLALNALSLIDYAATSWELGQGAAEGNPVMRAAIEAGPWAGLAFKTTAMLLVSAIIWNLRSYRRIAQVLLVATGAYMGLMVYHVIGTVSLVIAATVG